MSVASDPNRKAKVSKKPSQQTSPVSPCLELVLRLPLPAGEAGILRSRMIQNGLDQSQHTACAGHMAMLKKPGGSVGKGEAAGGYSVDPRSATLNLF